MRRLFLALAVLTVPLSLSLPQAAAAQSRETPYWASISAGQARMRTGPGRNFPISWLYQRESLPVRVIEVYNDWRKIEDPDGAQGWMLASLLSASRTGMVIGEVRIMREAPEPNAQIRYRAEPGVVGRLSNCRRGWCEFDVRGRVGYIRASHLYGVAEDERVE